MSYILDALRKSEQEREFSRVVMPPDDRGAFSGFMKRPLWPLAVGAALVLIVLATSIRVWWEPGRPAPVVSPAPPLAAVVTSGPVAVDVAPVKPGSAPVKREVRDLAKQLAVVSRKPKRKRTAKVTEPPPVATRAAGTPAPTPTAAAAVEVWQTLPDPSLVPFLRQMPDRFRRNIPKMAINVHLYSADEDENLVYINNRQYRRGEKIEGKIRIEAIVEEGVVMIYEGTRFKLPRPN
ncbi:MAG: general secretion pathway protein GspB [Gammaproteobacteria bacterium]|nr:general secretion pathway protein GspB [Gammaproteobacteria bacterium]